MQVFKFVVDCVDFLDLVWHGYLFATNATGQNNSINQVSTEYNAKIFVHAGIWLTMSLHPSVLKTSVDLSIS